jgi:hypothetical protein
MNNKTSKNGSVWIQVSVLPVLLISSLLVAGCDNASVVTAPEPERVRLAADQNYVDFGSHVVHVNAMTTNQLTPAVAATYDIVRSDNRAMLNVVILEKDATPQGKPASGKVTVSAANLTGQLKSVDVRKVQDGDNIYYIGDVSIDNQERLNFQIDVVPDGASQPMRLLYSRQFYTD